MGGANTGWTSHLPNKVVPPALNSHWQHRLLLQAPDRMSTGEMTRYCSTCVSPTSVFDSGWILWWNARQTREGSAGSNSWHFIPKLNSWQEYKNWKRSFLQKWRIRYHWERKTERQKDIILKTSCWRGITPLFLSSKVFLVPLPKYSLFYYSYPETTVSVSGTTYTICDSWNI